jgi:LuxR family maltose regulon positive regulatory protein
MLGGEKEAGDSLREALRLALPDRLLLPFAENHAMIVEPLGVLLAGMDSDIAASISALANQVESGRQVITGTAPVKRKFGLSPREHDTARLMAEGLSYDEIASQLFISVNTVKTHLKNAYSKTGTSSRSALKKLLQT